jgi:hypothetical protein
MDSKIKSMEDRQRSFLIKKTTLLVAGFLFISLAMHAGAPAAAVASANATEGVTQIGTWSTDIIAWFRALVGIFAIAGGFIVFVQYMQGDSSAQANFIKLVIGLAIFGLMFFIVRLFLGVNAAPTTLNLLTDIISPSMPFVA